MRGQDNRAPPLADLTSDIRCEQTKVRLWSVPRQREMATLNLYPGSLKGELDEITFVEFSPDGNNLAMIIGNRTLKLLRASPFSETDPRTISRH